MFVFCFFSLSVFCTTFHLLSPLWTSSPSVLSCSDAVLAATALRDVEVFVPAAVRRGETTRLHCMYDLEGDTLYAVKWYKGRREFYRYTPKENPAMKTFAVNGINVLVSTAP